MCFSLIATFKAAAFFAPLGILTDRFLQPSLNCHNFDSIIWKSEGFVQITASLAELHVLCVTEHSLQRRRVWGQRMRGCSYCAADKSKMQKRLKPLDFVHILPHIAGAWCSFSSPCGTVLYKRLYFVIFSLSLSLFLVQASDRMKCFACEARMKILPSFALATSTYYNLPIHMRVLRY